MRYVSNDFEPNMRLLAWGISLGMVGGILHFGYRTHSIGSALGASLLVLAVGILLAVWMTARNLRRLNRALRDEEAGLALQTVEAPPNPEQNQDQAAQNPGEPPAPQQAA